MRRVWLTLALTFAVMPGTGCGAAEGEADEGVSDTGNGSAFADSGRGSPHDAGANADGTAET